nr:MFS transporter [Pseudohalocynthiibacter aestuariivivens]
MLLAKIHQIMTGTHVSADAGEPQRFLRHFASLAATKLADGLIDPKLVLAWLMGALGAPGYMVGALVPIREAGALLPQILLARWIQRRRIRKYFWAGGSLLQGLAALGIAFAALTLDGTPAAWAILLCLAILALARAACSASYKDIAARTLAKGSRGTVSGAAGTVAAAAVFAFALGLSFGILPLSMTSISIAITVAGVLWLAAAILFVQLDEPEAEPQTNSFEGFRALLGPLRDDTEFRTYILVRGLLISTALAPPFLVMLSHAGGERELGNLGLLMVASSLAAITSSYVWGRLSDRSSRWTLAFSGTAAAVALGGAAMIGLLTGGIGGQWMAALFIFVAQIAYEGVRAGRKTHLTDMDTHGRKAIYTALSNTVIGTLLLAGGGFGLLAEVAGPSVVLAVFAVSSAFGAMVALKLGEVQQR